MRNKAAVQKLKTAYIFTFGNVGAGKSTLLASLAKYLQKTDSFLFRINLKNRRGSKLLLREWLAEMEMGNFPPTSRVGEIIEVDLGIEDFNGREKIGMTFLEISGEDLREIDASNEEHSGEFADEIKYFIERASLFIIVISSDRAKLDDSLSAQFFEKLIEYEIDAPVLLVVSKWDLTDCPVGEMPEFVRTNLTHTWQWLNSDRFTIAEAMPFSVGKVLLEDRRAARISEMNLDYSRNLLKWILEKISMK